MEVTSHLALELCVYFIQFLDLEVVISFSIKYRKFEQYSTFANNHIFFWKVLLHYHGFIYSKEMEIKRASTIC